MALKQQQNKEQKKKKKEAQELVGSIRVRYYVPNLGL